MGPSLASDQSSVVATQQALENGGEFSGSSGPDRQVALARIGSPDAVVPVPVLPILRVDPEQEPSPQPQFAQDVGSWGAAVVAGISQNQEHGLAVNEPAVAFLEGTQHPPEIGAGVQVEMALDGQPSLLHADGNGVVHEAETLHGAKEPIGGHQQAQKELARHGDGPGEITEGHEVEGAAAALPPGKLERQPAVFHRGSNRAAEIKVLALPFPHPATATEELSGQPRQELRFPVESGGKNALPGLVGEAGLSPRHLS